MNDVVAPHQTFAHSQQLTANLSGKNPKDLEIVPEWGTAPDETVAARPGSAIVGEVRRSFQPLHASS